jgi:hypothetical protein
MAECMKRVLGFIGGVLLFMAALLPAFYLALWMCPFDHISPAWVGFVIVYFTLYFWFRKASIWALSKIEKICKGE